VNPRNRTSVDISTDRVDALSKAITHRCEQPCITACRIEELHLPVL
jgi:hypothetical protein